jgi:hypothetical protein
MSPPDAWPSLEGNGCEATRESLLYWGQILGKTRLSSAPMTNHWWQVPLYVTARGLTTSPMSFGPRVVDVELDLIDHKLVARSSEGGVASMALCDQPLSGFYAEYARVMGSLGVELAIRPVAVEIPDLVRLDRDARICRYDPDWANRFLRALVRIDQVFKAFRGKFRGKASPVHFFWGAFDLAATRFSGRPAPRHPGGVPHVSDAVMVEAYSEEVSSAGFWPGDARFPEPAFYAYAYPEPKGFAEAAVRPAGARYDRGLGEFLIPYAAVRAAPDPSAALMAFLDSTYAAAAELGGWDPALVRKPSGGPTSPGSR